MVGDGFRVQREAGALPQPRGLEHDAVLRLDHVRGLEADAPRLGRRRDELEADDGLVRDLPKQNRLGYSRVRSEVNNFE